MRAITFWLIFAGALPFAHGAYDTPQDSAIALNECEQHTPACAQQDNLIRNLAARLRSEHRYTEARSVYQHALEVAKATHAPDDPRVAAALNGLALLQRDLGEYEAAAKTAEQALAILRNGKNPLLESDSLVVLGTVRQAAGRLPEARASFEQAANLRLKLLGPADPRVAEVWTGLAMVHRNRGNLKRAEALYRAALAIFEKNDPLGERALVLNNLARVLADRGRWKEAAIFYCKAVGHWESTLGPDHPNVAIGLTSLAALLRQHGRLADAEKLLERALDISQRRLGPDDAEIGREMATLAELRGAQGRLTEATDLYEHGIATMTATWGADNPQLLPWLDGYSRFLHSQEHFGEAERIRLQATRIRVVNTLRDAH